MSKTFYGSSHGSLAGYTTGFILSLILTIVPFYFVSTHRFSGWYLTWLLIMFALAQLFVQLICFLHLGKSSKPRWNVGVLLFTFLFTGIVVIGSLWIMSSLHYRMGGLQTEEYIIQDEGIKVHEQN